MDKHAARDAAEGIALQALGFLASDAELLSRFLALSGIGPSQIRQAAAEPGFLAGLLAFFLAHEPSLMKLAEATGLTPDEITAAARALPTGDNRYEASA